MTQTVAAALRTRDGRRSPAELAVHRYGTGTRLLRAGVIVVTSALIGAATIVIPAVHLVSTWAIPLMGLGIAAWVFQIRGSIDRASGRCPACGHDVVQEGLGALTSEATWLHCPGCSLPIELVWEPA